jgi:hypothetical protein
MTGCNFAAPPAPRGPTKERENRSRWTLRKPSLSTASNAHSLTALADPRVIPNGLCLRSAGLRLTLVENVAAHGDEQHCHHDHAPL